MDEAPDFVVGDRVFLERADLRSTRPSHKLDFRCFGPFKISQKLSDTAYRLDLPDGWSIHNVFHVSCLVPARNDTILGRRQVPPLPIIVEGSEEVEIERILKERRSRGGVAEFLVKWKGYDESENEWKKEYDMEHARELIEQFRVDERTRGKRRGRRGTSTAEVDRRGLFFLLLFSATAFVFLFWWGALPLTRRGRVSRDHVTSYLTFRRHTSFPLHVCPLRS